MSNIIIIGATSGIGRECAKLFISKGYKVGIAGRRIEALKELKELSTNNVFYKQIDVTKDDSISLLKELIDDMGGTDIIFNCAGIGFQNRSLNVDTEIKIVNTNVVGFVKIADFSFNYFSEIGKGHFAAITSIAGTKGLGASPAYSATKGFQNIYIQSLSQLSKMNNADITYTDIRPGFVDTDLLADSRKYPLLMNPEYVAKKIVRAIEHRKRVIVIDWKYKILVFFWRLIPNYLWERLPIKN